MKKQKECPAIRRWTKHILVKTLGAYVEQKPYATSAGASLSGCTTVTYDREIEEWLRYAKVLAEQEKAGTINRENPGL